MLTDSQARELRQLVASGQKIAAIKRYREITSVGLEAAKRAVEDLAKSGSHRLGSPAPPLGVDSKRLREAEAAALAAIRTGRLMEAIKSYRLHTGLGLKESKDAVDTLRVVHQTEGRVDARMARLLIGKLAAGQKQEAITLLMSGKGYDEPEARALVGTIGGAALGRGCARGALVLALVLAILAFGLAYGNCGALLDR